MFFNFADRPIQQHLQVTAKWNGQTIDKKGENLGGTDYFTLPFVFLHFLPTHSVQNIQVLRLWIGWQFLRSDLLHKKVALSKKLQAFQFKLLWIINDEIKVNKCLFERELNKYEKIEVPILDKYLSNPEFSDEEFSDYHLNILWSKPLLIPQKCLQPGRFNEIKLVWLPNAKETTDQYNQKTNQLKIRFFWPKLNQFKFSFVKQKEFFLQQPFLYWIRFNLGTPPLISQIAYQKLRFLTNIENQYHFTQPFDGAFQLYFYPWIWSQEFKDLLLIGSDNLQNFFLSVIEHFFFHFQTFLLNTKTDVLDVTTKKTFQLDSKIIISDLKQSPELFNRSQKYLKFTHFFLPNIKNVNFPILSITNFPDSQAVLFTNLYRPELQLQLKTNILFTNFLNWQIILLQPVEFRNNWNQLKFKKYSEQDFVKDFEHQYIFSLFQLYQLLTFKTWKEINIAQYKV